ncbi:MAG TPA: tRNA adenosine(34) deaminase TadA [Verrucomicrobiae bacterium]|jgi:tRNA(adenine34) deaminase|nr:tRNA adenosine(34) deaminase TadA [Verrucomicrobiae bacterium]
MAEEPIIDLHSDQYFMGEALRQAARAYEAEEVPVGAVVVREGRIIARAFNQVELLKDATAHAEMLVLTQAEEVVGDWRLTDCTLYVTKEPCPMCAGAIVHVRLARVVFGAGDPKGGAAGGMMNLVQHPSLNHRCEITAGIREHECRALLQTFFGEQRAKGKKSGNGMGLAE